MRYHELSLENNNISRRAAECAYRQQLFASEPPLRISEEIKSKRMILAATNVIDLYTEAMYLFRLKWLEGQESLQQMTEYKLRVIPPRDPDSDDSDADVSGIHMYKKYSMVM